MQEEKGGKKKRKKGEINSVVYEYEISGGSNAIMQESEVELFRLSLRRLFDN